MKMRNLLQRALSFSIFFFILKFNIRAQNMDGLANDSLKAPLFSTVDINGDSIILKKYLGKVVVLNFWYIHCKPCIAEMPSLNLLVEKFKTKDVVFIAITQDNKWEVKIFFQNPDHVFFYRQVIDGEWIIKKYVDAPLKAKENGPSSFADPRPANIVIDKNGSVIDYGVGGGDIYPLWIEKAVEKALK